MQTLQNGYKGLSLLMLLNWDRALCLGAIGAAMWISVYIAG
ncbi:hypothetical protein [uncultured Pseudosulfitobacter sp.]|jgi:hypothetical protein|tara:strand:- start:24 stop:146 length:123 start_codon:yes stop_codon:yes gene_type:complete